jgi:hypothetical protein
VKELTQGESLAHSAEQSSGSLGIGVQEVELDFQKVFSISPSLKRDRSKDFFFFSSMGT